jgi:hypothetical protein
MQVLLRRRPHRLPRCLGQIVQRREVKLNVAYNPDLKRMKHLKEDGFSISTKPIVHDAEPVFRGRLQEHVRFYDKNFMHVAPEDEHIGLAIVGLHPKTRKGDLRRKLMSLGTIRHCWICAYVASLHSLLTPFHSTGTETVVLVRFQDPRSKSSAKGWLESLQEYPFAILDRHEGHWNAPAPSDWPKLRFEPLTTKYDFIEPKQTKILLFRSWFIRETIVTRLVEPYQTRTQRPKLSEPFPSLSHSY